MARKKVKLAYIVNSSIRRTTFRKRCRNVLKKVQEVATLCDVKACAVIYEPWERKPEVWPNEQEAKKILQQVKDLPHLEQSKKVLDQEEFVRNRKLKQQERLCKVMNESHELELTRQMLLGLTGGSLHDLHLGELSSLDYFIGTQERVVQDLMETIKSRIVDGTSSAPRINTLDRQCIWGMDLIPSSSTRPIDDALAQQWGKDLMPSSTERMFFESSGGDETGGLEDIIRPYMHG